MSFRKRVKSLLPKPVVVALISAYNLFRQCRHPKIKRYPGEDSSVLNCEIAYNEFGGYCVALNAYMHAESQAIYKGHVWEPETITYIRAMNRKGDVIHAGTNFGDFLPAISPAFKENLIWAFEPNPESYRCAQITILINGLNNVKLSNKAIGEHASIEKMKVVESYYGESMGGGSRMASKAKKIRSEDELVDVEVVVIDQVVLEDRDIALIHLDIEGFETEALSGALKTIKRCKPILIIETLPNDDWLSKNLFNLGYSVSNQKIDDNHIIYPSS